MPHRILVVDDDGAFRSLVKDELESRGLKVIEATDYVDALKMLKRERPHLVLIDFLLPKKNGFAIAETIRSDADLQTLPIVMVSGVFKNPRTAVEAREKYQVVEFLSKPTDMDQLFGLISRTLKGVPVSEAPPPRSTTQTATKDRPAELVSPSLDLPSARPASLAPKAYPARGLSYGSRASSPATSALVAPPSSPPQGPADSAPARKKPTASQENRTAVARPFPEILTEGSLEQTPVALLIATARYDAMTGLLDLTAADRTHRRIYILKGQPIFMQSNAEGENVGALLLRRGRITEPDLQRCLTYVDSKKRTLQQAILDLRLATESDLATAYKLLAGQLLPMAIGMSAGTFKWRETDAFVGRIPEGNFDTLSVLFDGIRRHVGPPQILRFFEGREDVPLTKAAEFEALLPSYSRAFGTANVAARIDGKATYRDLARDANADSPNTAAQLFALATSGMLMLPSIEKHNSVDVAVNQAAAAASKAFDESLAFVSDAMEASSPSASTETANGQWSPEEIIAQSRVERAHGEILSKDFYAVLGMKRGESQTEQVRDAYFRLAKQWHHDAFVGLRLGDAKSKLDEIFARITEAYETLTNAALRHEYDVFLDRRAKGLPTDVAQVFKAEGIFDEGLLALKRKDLRTAHKHFSEASELNAGEALFWAHLGWTTFMLNSGSDQAFTQAVQLLKKAIGLNENLPCAYQFMGQICLQRGRADEAKKWFKRCLEWEPENIDANRALRLMQQRKDDRGDKGSGILGRFLPKK